MSTPFAWGQGLATIAADGTVLDAWFPSPRLGRRPSNVDPHLPPARFMEHLGDDPRRRVRIDYIDVESELQAQPVSTADVYLRLHLLSHLLVEPNSINLDGIFGKMPVVAWTTAGPVAADDFAMLRMPLQRAGISVTSLDRFPRLLDYVTPPGVRIADANRVRLGAHLAPGTTVMHEGFVNFNAGTLGSSMVEGRISQGVVVGSGSDIGGGASIMGTLSGGGAQRVSIGKRALLGANSGVGISIGDDCVVEAGLYITAGTKVVLLGQDAAGAEGERSGGGEGAGAGAGEGARIGQGASSVGDGIRSVKAIEVSGVPNLLFRRNSLTGAVEVLPRSGQGIALNPALH
ncbi:DapH/DapD/GlmU-related protein [Ruicaihuangia caeni]|uniref:2,3,4,5-tetrahydropyridine-2,6-dicarboxylate N-succinyltransferase n=1 Tax=Ruicaihuangia caeni TaxID=3042517 RepID=A0AAW6TBH0_9MICO|nr:DapH/DapD/GlmU-related protein [Klugiella sp. YN-L-19]MDI2099658.1 DapH/DapD/GlmU-related protein [Klugiella sp. YN-L-19]